MSTDYLPAMIEPRLLRVYDRFARLMGATGVYWRLVAQAAIPPGATVLEIGCGTGNVLLRAKRAVPDAVVTGIDPDPQALEIARGKAAAEGVTLRLDRGSATELPYDDGSVDRVLSSLMLHHLHPDEQVPALREVHRVLAPGGSLHLVDLDEDPRTAGRLSPLHRVLSFVQRIGGGHAGHVHGHGPDREQGRGPGREQGREQGHGHGHGHGAARPVPEVLAEAGFTAPVMVGRDRTRIGGVTFHRAAR